jgi:hypothetical protein
VKGAPKKPTGAELVRRRKLDNHERVIEGARKSFIEMGRALGQIRRDRLFEPSFSSFAEYCEARWEISEAYANRVINAARVALISTPIGVEINSEAVARELVPLTDDPAAIGAVYEEAERLSENGRVTAQLIRKARETLYPAARVIDGEVADDPDEDRSERRATGSELVDALTQAIQETEQTAAESVHVYAPADGVETQPLRVDDAPAAGDAEFRSASPAVTPTDPPTGQPSASDMPVRSLVATPDQSEISHPHAGEAQDPHASEGSGAGATPSLVEERTASPGEVLPEVPASAYPPGSVPLDPAGEGPAAVRAAAGHPDPVMQLLDAIEQITKVCKLDAWDIAQLGDDSCFDALVLAGDEFAEFVLSVQHTRVELSLDRRS